MWILPKNYPLSSHFARDMVASSEDLSLPGLNITLSLMWRSKPTPLQTWLRKWKRDYWFQRLCTRILKPSHRKSFEERLASSLADIHANHFQPQENEKDLTQKQDISGGISGDIFKQLDLFDASLKTSKAISRLDSAQLSATWRKMVTDARSEYSRRMKSVRPISAGASGSWATWPTATVFDVTGGSYPTELVKGQWRSKHSKDPNTPWYGAKLRDAVKTAERIWPTPTVGEEKFRLKGNSQASQCLEAKARKGELDHQSGHLNPDWVEWLMGVPTGWTDLGCWGME